MWMEVDLTQIARALELLRAGDVVAIPTETVYGLAADATRAEAVRRIYEIKGRPSTNPLIAHVSSIEVAERFAHVDDRARRIFDHYSPGPISVVLPRKAGPHSICTEATAGLASVAIRIPDHPVALELLRQFDGPLAAPSANRSNHVSPTTAAHVRDEFGGRVFVLDGGACNVGIESTVLELTTDRARILRPGQITKQMIEALIGGVESVAQIVPQNQAKPSPGMHERHYAPRTAAIRFDPDQRGLVEARFTGTHSVVVCFGSRAIDGLETCDLTSSPNRAAHDFYDTLRKIDSRHFETILVEMPPNDPVWDALRDRIRRATRPIAAFERADR